MASSLLPVFFNSGVVFLPFLIYSISNPNTILISNSTVSQISAIEYHEWQRSRSLNSCSLNYHGASVTISNLDAAAADVVNFTVWGDGNDRHKISVPVNESVFRELVFHFDVLFRVNNSRAVVCLNFEVLPGCYVRSCLKSPGGVTLTKRVSRNRFLSYPMMSNAQWRKYVSRANCIV